LFRKEAKKNDYRDIVECERANVHIPACSAEAASSCGWPAASHPLIPSTITLTSV